jgi:chromosome segregation ATPase
LARTWSHNQTPKPNNFSTGEAMVGLTGLEKFSHLEDKIYRTIELTKALRQEKENLERELASLRREMGNLLSEKERLEAQVERLLAERDTIRMKVEAMLDAISVLDPEIVEQVRR